MHQRGFIFLNIASIVIFSYNFKPSKIKSDKRILRKTDNIIYITIILISIFVIISNLKIYTDSAVKHIADYLDENATKDIKIYTPYLLANGNYLEYRGYKCYIDARAEAFLKANNHKEDIFIEHYNLFYGNLDVKDFLNKYNFDYLLIEPFDKIMINYLRNNNEYIKVYEIYDDDHDLNHYLYKKII